jgi:hypothetical protein
VNPTGGSFWDKTQLVVLRLLSILLALIDRLFNVQWGEHLLERMAGRWETKLKELDRTLATLEEERQQLQVQAEAVAIHAATIYLGGRSLTHNELRFDPAIPHDEEILDATIDLLVKQKLAAIATEEIEPEHFVYYVEPDWEAIRAHLGRAADQANPDIAEWFREGLRFIDEALLPQTSAQTEWSPSIPHQE